MTAARPVHSFTGKKYVNYPRGVTGSFYAEGYGLCTTCRLVLHLATEVRRDTLGRPLCPVCGRMVRLGSRN